MQQMEAKQQQQHPPQAQERRTAGETPGEQQQQQVASTKKPRRRRLAHRRQYTKSRRLASSYLRSQFVRYDSCRDDDDDNDDGHWWVPQRQVPPPTSTPEAGGAQPNELAHKSTRLPSTRSDGGHEGDCELDGDDDERLAAGEYGCRAGAAPAKQRRRAPGDSPTDDGSSTDRLFLLSLQPDEEFIRQTHQLSPGRKGQQQVPSGQLQQQPVVEPAKQQLQKLAGRQPPPPLPRRRLRIATMANCPLNAATAYSSSSLDSSFCSPAHSERAAPFCGQQASATQHGCGVTAAAVAMAVAGASAPCGRSPGASRSPLANRPPALLARSLVSLTNVGAPATSARQLQTQQQVPHMIRDQLARRQEFALGTSASGQCSANGDRVVRSNTIDLNNVGATQQPVSPRLSFYQQCALHDRHQSQFNFSYDSMTNVSALGPSSGASPDATSSLCTRAGFASQTPPPIATSQRASSIAATATSASPLAKPQFVSLHQSVDRAAHHHHLVHQRENVEVSGGVLL